MKETIQDPEQVIVFGGSFNPPTIAHERIIQACLDAPDFDEVWVMPSGDRADKHMANTDDQRLSMLRTMRSQEFDDNPRLKVTDFEIQLPKPTQTIRTVGALALAYPKTSFWFVYGADSYADMPQWENGAELQARLSVLLLPRSGSTLPDETDRIKHLPSVLSEAADISSTQVREAITSRKDISAFVSSSVRRYIASQELYA